MLSAFSRKPVWPHVILLLALGVTLPPMSAMDQGGAPLKDPTTTHVATDGRPVAVALDFIRQRCRCVITYEDPIWDAADQRQVSDISERLGRENVIRPVIVPKTESFEFDLIAPRTIRGPDDWVPTVEKMLAAFHRATRGPVRFRVERAGTAIHVLPVGPQPSRLATRISISESENSADRLLTELLDRANETDAYPIMLGERPRDHFARSVIRLKADREPLRDVLQRLFQETGRKIAFHLNFDPTLNRYYLLARFADPATCTDLTPEQGRFTQTDATVCRMDPGDSENAVWRKGPPNK